MRNAETATASSDGASNLDELQRQYAALGFSESQAPGQQTAPEASNLDELQRKYAALGFSQTQAPVQPTEDGVPAAGSSDKPNSATSSLDGAQLDELQEQYAELFKQRPLALDLVDTGESWHPSVAAESTQQGTTGESWHQGTTGESWHRGSAQTPDSSSASTCTAAPGRGMGGIGGIDEFALYQRFRLHMVKMFGSLASALFELGADPEEGISRDAFAEVLSGRLQLFSRAEANSLFSHATNADIMENGVGGVATYRDFSISEDEWRSLVSAKQDTSKQRSAMPFQSGPTGVSLGIYHRNVTLNQVCGEPRSSGKGSPKGSPTATQDLDAAPAMAGGSPKAPHTPKKMAQHSRPLRRALLKTGERVWPWRLPQKPWAPSMMAGEGFLEQASVELPKAAAQRSRTSERTFKTTPRGQRYKEPTYSVMEQSSRPEVSVHEAAGHPVATIPSNRSEMEPRACVRQVAVWWPYQRPAPPPKLRSALPPLRKLKDGGG
jgi:hypothetical protein